MLDKVHFVQSNFHHHNLESIESIGFVLFPMQPEYAKVHFHGFVGDECYNLNYEYPICKFHHIPESKQHAYMLRDLLGCDKL